MSLLGDDAETYVVDHDRETGLLRLAAHDASRLEVGAPVELRSGEEAPLLATRLITGTPLGGELPPVAMRLATTRGTNALLERRGARTVHFITAGFEDLLAIGDQRRPDLFSLHIERPASLPEEVVGVRERLAADGLVIEALDRDTVAVKIAALRARGFDCASIALLHGHRNTSHEELLEKLLRDAGFEYVARSSALSPFQGLLRRSQTSATDAYLGPVISWRSLPTLSSARTSRALCSTPKAAWWSTRRTFRSTSAQWVCAFANWSPITPWRRATWW